MGYFQEVGYFLEVVWRAGCLEVGSFRRLAHVGVRTKRDDWRAAKILACSARKACFFWTGMVL